MNAIPLISKQGCQWEANQKPLGEPQTICRRNQGDCIHTSSQKYAKIVKGIHGVFCVSK